MNIIDELLDEEVIIDWASGEADWQWYIIKGVDEENGWFKLQGSISPDGAPYTGPPIYVPYTEISCIEKKSDFYSGNTNGHFVL